MPFKVLVVDDSSFFRRRVTEILNQDKDLEVVGVAGNGQEAIAKAIELRPDVITMDIEMPVMDGITAVGEIMRLAPTAILMFSSLTHQGAKATLDALDAGALDFLPKKFEDIARDKNEAVETLQQRVKAIARRRSYAGRSAVSSATGSAHVLRQTIESTLRSKTEDTHRPLVDSSLRSVVSHSSRPMATAAFSASPASSTRTTTTSRPSFDNARSSVKPAAERATPAFSRNPLAPPVAKEPVAPPAGFQPSRLEPSTGAKPPAPLAETATTAANRKINSDFQILAIGTSTGGPVALQTILMALPASYPKPILLIQHMPATFTNAFAARLDTLCKIHVKEAQDGDILKPGTAYLAPGGKQMLLEGTAQATKIKIKEDNSERITYKPSVDITFGSTAKIFRDKVLAVVLTGMGADGREGARLLKKYGSRIWAQDEQSCVVYGMPQAIYAAGLAEYNISLKDMASWLIKEVGHG